MSLTPEQQKAVALDRQRLCVDAGAGSGKTRVLVDRILRLVETRKGGLDAIVSITFTENAAAEMKARLRGAFRDRGNAAATPDEQNRWRALERRVESARISTFHSFCMGIAKQFGLRSGEDPDFTVLTDAETRLLLDEVVLATLHALLERDDSAAVNVATEYGVARLAEIIRGILGRRHLLEQVEQEMTGLDADALVRRWSALYFAEQRRLILDLFVRPETMRLVAALRALDGACTDDTDKREIERRDWLALLSRRPESASPDSAVAELRRLINDGIEGRANAKKWGTRESFDEAGALLEDVKGYAKGFLVATPDPLTEIRAASLTCALLATVMNVHRAYQQAKTDRNVRDFDDLMLSAYQLLRDNEGIRQEVARGIRYLLIDEFQDTDSRQLEVAEMLAAVEGGPDLFIVGDAKQSIYLFRGAEVEVFNKAATAAGREGTIPLDTNFRSVPEILGFVNHFFATTGLLSAVAPVYRPIRAHREPTGECRVEFLLPPCEEERTRRTEYRPLEADLLARRIAEMCSGTNRVQVGAFNGTSGRPAEFGDVALLFQTLNNVQVYEQALKQQGIPYTLIAGRGYYQRPEIVDLRNLLTLVCNPWDEMALLGFLRSPLVGLNDDSVFLLGHTRGLADFFHSNTVPPQFPQEDELARARSLYRTLHREREKPLVTFLRDVLVRTQAEAIVLGQYLGRRRALNLRKVLDLAEAFGKARPPKLTDFVRHLDDVAREELREGEAALASGTGGTVLITTIHQAKGLEYPIVFLPDISRGQRPAGGRDTDLHARMGMAAGFCNDDGENAVPVVSQLIRLDKQLHEQDEFARLLYVALTRARDWLVLSGLPTTQSAKQSWLANFDRAYGILEASDGDLVAFEHEGGSVQFRVRRQARPQQVMPSPIVSAKALDKDALLRQIAPLPLPTTSRRTFSVTQVARQMAHAELSPPSPSVGEARPLAPSGTLDARARGTLVHAALERWDGSTNIEALVAEVIRQYCPALPFRDTMAADLMQVLQRIEDSSMQRWWQPGLRIEREKPFILRIGDALLTGTLDAYVHGGPILDYKTGKGSPDLNAQYECQLLLYAAAVKTLTGGEPKTAYLLYVDTGEVHEVPVNATKIEDTLRQAKAAIDELCAGDASVADPWETTHE